MRIAALSVCFLSGFAALLYQVVWQRILVIFSGADAYSSTLIVAAFMAGLGVGYLTGGHIADRVSRATALLLFAAAEAAIAAFGLVSRGLYYDVLYERLGAYAFAAPLLSGILFISLLWPTFFMGLSLPLLARALTDRVERAAFTVGSLYAFNTLGAAAGALEATWTILPSVGMDVSLRIAAALNLVCVAIALPFVPRLRRRDGGARSALLEPSGTALSLPERAWPRLPLPVWTAVFALSGFIALGLEIAWVRLLGVMMKSTTFTFGTLLAIYLAGIGGGALAGSRLAARIARPDITYLMLQAAAGLTAGLLLVLMMAAAENVAWLNTY
jgi:spermidine synthase